MIELKKLTKSFGNKTIFKDIDISFKNHSVYAVLGDSGVGKTTLFQILFGLDNNYSGDYFLFDENTKDFSNEDWNSLRSSKIQIVYQDFKLLESMSVFENLYYACNKVDFKSINKCNDILKEMNLDKLKEKKVNQLSGGEKQRLAFARALVNSPEIILLDEPTGNLDDTNAKIILDYIRKLNDKDVIVIVITHDSRVIPFCDEVYRIENKKILCEKYLSDEEEMRINQKFDFSKKIFKRFNFKYTLSSIKNNIFDIILSNLPIMALFVIFIIIFSSMWSLTINSLDKFYNGLSHDGIYISSSVYTDSYINELMEKNLTPKDDGKRIFFSLEDLKMVKDIDGVKDAILCDIGITNTADTNENTLNFFLKKNDLGAKVKEMPSYSNFPNRIKFNFQTMKVPKEYIDTYNPENLQLIYGEYPDDNTNEIIIPDFYALSLSNNINSIVGTSIELEVSNNSLEKEKNNYMVTGIFKSNFENNISNSALLYLGYRERSNEILELMKSDESYQRARNMHISENGTVNNSLYESKDSYVKAIGTGKGDILIKLANESKSEYVSAELKELFPNLKFLSKTEMENGEFKAAYISLWKTILIMGSIISILFGIIIIFLHRSYIRKRNKELSILYSLGYSKKDIYKILLYEYYITNITNFIFAYILIFILNYFYFQYSSYFVIISNVFTVTVFLMSFIFVMFMTLISIVFSLNGIKQNNLQKYLR